MSDSPRSRIFARVQQASRPADADTIQRELESLGSFKSDSLPIGDIAKYTVAAQKAFDRAGWK